jgi:hypothetical protein
MSSGLAPKQALKIVARKLDIGCEVTLAAGLGRNLPRLHGSYAVARATYEAMETGKCGGSKEPFNRFDSFSAPRSIDYPHVVG